VNWRRKRVRLFAGRSSAQAGPLTGRLLLLAMMVGYTLSERASAK
jgi:hypothetical protein